MSSGLRAILIMASSLNLVPREVRLVCYDQVKITMLPAVSAHTYEAAEINMISKRSMEVIVLSLLTKKLSVFQVPFSGFEGMVEMVTA